MGVEQTKERQQCHMRRKRHSPQKRAGDEPSVSGAVGRFALPGLIAFAVVGVVSFLILRNVGTSEALKNARNLTQIVGRGIVEPNLTEGLVRGRPADLARFDRVIRERVLGDPIVRVKLWTPNGRVVYSDDQVLIGRRFKLGADEVASLRNGNVDSGDQRPLAAREPLRARTRKAARGLSAGANPGRAAAAVRGLPALQLGRRQRP